MKKGFLEGFGLATIIIGTMAINYIKGYESSYSEGYRLGFKKRCEEELARLKDTRGMKEES